ncbi:copper-binding protein [Hyphomicrobium sp. 802]|uniref:copper-binding protein n=1 Tax=unclassified Hyphomicrobium TaxID=2619925 RepID=UPI0004B47C43
MMKRSKALLISSVVASLISVAASAEDAKSLPIINGVVKKIDSAAGKMTIKHQAITNLDMGAMTMVFKANDPAMLKTVKAGDKIKFSADKINGQITVMMVEKAK